jgi:glutamate-1-semialdehyde 2,1-aminomutase/spore coat polysaccharide biosynthesis protein SpsF
MSQGNKVVAIAQARMGSTRFPGKVMTDLEGIPVLQWTVNALWDSHGLDDVVIATSTLPADDIIAHYCSMHGINCFRGSETDVLDRFYQCAKEYKADIILRLTCDCPFLDPSVISEVIRLREMTNAEYATNTDPPTYPDGLDVECFTFAALECAHKEAIRSSDRDCVTRFIVRNRHRFPAANLRCPLPGLEKERWVLDTKDDFSFCLEIAKRIGTSTSYLEILDILATEPELRQLNPGIRNERFYEGISDEQLPTRTFTRSQRLYERASQTIPFAAQTFSKSHLVFPPGRSPLFVSHGDGAYVYDVDGNDYVDLVSALLPVVLGYRDPDVDGAVRRQLDSGISFSLATEMEAQLAETLCRLIPCAEKVKFGKSGTDVTTAAVRLARAYTGRDHVLVGGYHGWADWSMSVTDRNLGIPEDVRKLSRRIPDGFSSVNDIGLLPSQVAAIIIEPNGDPEYLRWLRDYCTERGIVLIFDEIITGFRYDLGGAQKLFGVTPDLACFGKSMGNGMPISAVVGRAELMSKCEPPGNIFYSGTFFGETLGIAAALATIDKMERDDVIEHLWSFGTRLRAHINTIVTQLGLHDVVRLSGEAPLIKIDFLGEHKEKLRSLFIEQMAQNGVLIIGSNNLSFAHKDPQLKRIVTAYGATLIAIRVAIDSGSISQVEASAGLPIRASA